MELFKLKEGYFYHQEKELSFAHLLRRIKEDNYELIDIFEEKVEVNDTIWKLEHNFPIRVVLLDYNDKIYIVKGTNDIRNFEEFVNSSGIYSYFGKPFDSKMMSKTDRNMMLNNNKVQLFIFCVNNGVKWNEDLTRELLKLI